MQEQIEIVDSKVCEQIQGVDSKIAEMRARFSIKFQGMNNKYDNLAKTLASIQLQSSNMSRGKNRI